MTAKFCLCALAAVALAALHECVLAVGAHGTSGARAAQNTDTVSARECEWWKKMKAVYRPAVSLRTKLIQVRSDIGVEYRKCVGNVARAGVAGRHSNITRVRNSLDEKLWRMNRLVEDTTWKISSLTFFLRLCQAYAVPETSLQLKCEVASTRDNYVAPENITRLYTELEKAEAELFTFSKTTKTGRWENYHGKFSELLRDIKKVHQVKKLKEEIHEEIKSTERAIEEFNRQKSIFDRKMEIGCEMERRLNVMKDTFAALHNVAKDVVVKADDLSRRASDLKTKATALGVEYVVVNDTARAKEAAGNLTTEISAALQKVLDAMYGGGSRGLHAFLGYGNEFRHNVAWCRSETQLDRDVLVHLVSEERSSHLYDFGAWREATENLWAGMTNMSEPVHANCSGLENANCTHAFAQMNDLTEASRRSREDIETELGSAIRALETVWEQVLEERTIVAAKLERDRIERERQSTLSGEATRESELARGEHSASAAGVGDAKSVEASPHCDTVNMDIDDTIFGADVGESGDLEADAGTTSEVRGGKSSTTAAVAAVVSVVIVATAAVAVFVVYRRRPAHKDVAAL
ncbi:hypothetical protein ERJ75_001204900 [Trypanosoma vivax]|nr:hypothetical protein ERJ75_001204900 [Trypanosoma vivax]